MLIENKLFSRRKKNRLGINRRPTVER